MLDGLGLNADALSRAERIIANRKEKLTSTHSSFATSSSRSSSSSMYTADSDSYLNRVKQEFSNGIALKEAEKEIEKLKRNVETLEEKVEKLVAEKKVIEEVRDHLMTIYTGRMNPPCNNKTHVHMQVTNCSHDLLLFVSLFPIY